MQRKQMAAGGGAVLALLAAGMPAWGQASARDFLSGTVGEQELDVDYQTWSSFNADLDGQRGKMQMTRYNFSLSAPIHQTAQEEWLINANVGAFMLDTDARLPGTGDNLPGELWDLRLGASYRRKLANDWIVGGSLSVGSVADEPFASSDEWVVRFNGMLRMPAANPRDAWIVLLNFANDRQFLQNAPIPGFAYELNRDQLNAVLGVPFMSVDYRPVDRVSLNARYILPRIIHVEAAYQVFDPVELYVAYDWNNQRYFRAVRRDDDDLLFFFEQRVTGGVRWDLAENLSLDCSAGYAFERFFFEGEDYGDRGDSRINVDDGPFLQVQFAMSL